MSKKTLKDFLPNAGGNAEPEITKGPQNTEKILGKILDIPIDIKRLNIGEIKKAELSLGPIEKEPPSLGIVDKEPDGIVDISPADGFAGDFVEVEATYGDYTKEKKEAEILSGVADFIKIFLSDDEIINFVNTLDRLEEKILVRKRKDEFFLENKNGIGIKETLKDDLDTCNVILQSIKYIRDYLGGDTSDEAKTMQSIMQINITLDTLIKEGPAAFEGYDYGFAYLVKRGYTPSMEKITNYIIGRI